MSDHYTDEEELEIIQEPENADFIETVNENQALAEDDAPTEDQEKETKTKRVRNPQPKLDAERLKGSRGLIALEDMFKNVKFKGRNHEEEDLNLLMQTYGYWCHRLFPKYPLENCLQRLETLGNSKPIQTYIKKIRINEAIEDKPIVESDSDNEINDDVIAHTSSVATEEFDRLLPQPLPQATPSTATGNGELTEEQLERIRLNRERAQQRRKQLSINTSQLSPLSKESGDRTSFYNVSASQDSTTDSLPQESIINLELLDHHLHTPSLKQIEPLATVVQSSQSIDQIRISQSMSITPDLLTASQLDVMSIESQLDDNFHSSPNNLTICNSSQNSTSNSDAMVITQDYIATSQESETLPVCMSIDSETFSTQEMRDVCSPMDCDSV